MKFDKKIKIFLAVVSTSLLSACATTQIVKPVGLLATTESPSTLRSTVQFIPQRIKNVETGLLDPYVAQANPYTQVADKIDAASVQNFIAAKRAIQNGDSKTAEKLLVKITSEDKSLSGPWVLLGDVAKKRNDFDASIKHYKKAIEVNQNNVNAYIRLAILQREMGKFVAAQNTYSWALSRWKDFPEAHLNLAVVYDIYLNKPLKAQRHLEAYHFLTQGKDGQRASWLNEIQQRTGEEIELHVEKRKASTLASAKP
ncbi:MAG: tetratricopeptide repeat protein [Kangiellaceae bacterium]|nr:tetratricopeptide repeat protein [Kangiellaceae bacterium]MCW9015761.1 tetratricopeptide repeat protein [Kangiellaceae bacterium]